MTSRWTRLPAAALAFALAACTSTTVTEEPVTPTTYTAPSYRAASSVGRLARLAVAPLTLDWRDSNRSKDAVAFAAAQDAVRQDTRDALVRFLTETKGYTVVAMAEDADLRSDAARAAAGRLWGVDGIVVVERWIRQPWDTWDGLLNIALMNGPLVKMLSETSLRMSIYETASGRLVWQAEWHGRDTEAAPVDWSERLVDLDNAVPAVLQR